MRKSLVLAVLCILCAMAGCVSTATKGGAGGQAGRQKVAPADATAVTTGTDDFIKVVAAGKYDSIKQVVLPSQAQGFDPKAFVEDRFRMKLDEFDVVAWDMSSIGVTPVQGGELMTSTVVTVRVLRSNEPRPVYVNLRWHKESERWWLVPYPEAA